MGARMTATIALLALAFGFGLPGPKPVDASPASSFRDEAPRIAASSGTEEVSGDQPWAVLLCRFSDIDDTPQPPSYFETLFSADYPGLGHYWNEVSLGSMSLAGTDVLGWFDMDRTYGSFGLPSQDGMIPWNQVIDSCMRAADPAVRFPNYRGVAVMLNYDTLWAASLGRQSYTMDGRTRGYFTAVVGAPPEDPCSCPDDYSGWSSVGTVAHEMGHGMGFHHSSGPYGELYDSQWDVVSDPQPRDSTGSCRLSTPSYGCAPAHTLAHNKAAAGWVLRSQVTVVEAGSSATVLLHPTEVPTTGQMLAWVPLPAKEGRTASLSLEVRKRVGWDMALPGEGLVIHEVRPLDRNIDSVDAVVIDPDGNGDPNDEGAIWGVGETYIHPSGARVDVLGQEGDAFLVEIHNPLPDGTGNDARPDAVMIPGGGFTYRQSLEGATAANEDGQPGCVDSQPARTVWFSYDAAVAGDVVFTVEAESFSPTVVIYRGSTEISCTSVPAGMPGRIRLSAEYRRTYQVMIGSTNSAAGTVTVSMPRAIARSVKMKLTKHLHVAGSVAADELMCTQGQRVDIQKKVGTKWTRVTTATTRSNGTFVKKLADRTGTYRAVATDSFIDNDYACLYDASRTASHRH